MAADKKRQAPLLAGLLVVLALVVYWQFGGASPSTGRPPGSGRQPAAAVKPPSGNPKESPDAVLARGVGLERLTGDRPAPEEGRRDPFRSGPSASAGPGGSGPSAPAPPPGPVPVPVAPPIGPIGPPPPPPIAVKFIGVVSRHDVGKVAILSDGKNVYYGREGEIVDGRWRIIAIGEESLQIEYVDGRGRQTVRLTG